MYAGAIIVLSVGPALLFLLLILRMDRREPEPLRLVVKVIGLGAASAIVASVLELALERLPFFSAPGLAGAAASSLLEVAPIEEMCKLGVVLLFVWKDPNFNEENDGIVYVGASAIGFALLENIFFVAQNGIGTGILRAFTAIPLHVFTAVVLGLHVGMARFVESPTRRNLLVARGFLFAWAFHGVYDMLAMSGSALALLLLPLMGGLAAFGIVALRKGRRLSISRWEKAPAATATAAPAAARTDAAVDAALPPAQPSTEPIPAHPATAANRARPKAAAHKWMAVVSRILLISCALFWVVLILGLASSSSTKDLGYGVLGGILLTCIPGAIGISLEVVYHKHRRLAATGPGPGAGLSVN
jgi:RsiW-degrading membrane proteinase PrsW (M82 family)